MLDRFNLWVATVIAKTHELEKEDGQTFVEYALILATVVVGVLLAVTWTGLGDAITAAIARVTGAVAGN
jgi:Flp pilus assembly pilin Flp